MRHVRLVTEFLLRFLLWLTRVAFVALGLAAVGPALTLRAALPADATAAPLLALIRPIGFIGAIFLVAGILLFAAGRLVPRDETGAAGPTGPGPTRGAGPTRNAESIRGTGATGAAEPTCGDWRWILGPAMLGLACGTLLLSGRLVRFWAAVLSLLDDIGVWRELQRGGEFSGLIVAPVLAALSAPLLAAATACFLSAVPLLLVVLFATRSPLFRRAYLMTAICQLALLAAGVLAASAFADLARALARDPTLGTGSEVSSFLAALRWTAGVLTAIGRDHAWLTLGYCLLLPGVLFWRRRPIAPPADPNESLPSITFL